MMNLKQYLKQPLRALPSSLVIAIFVIALLGFADAAYLTVEHFMGVIPPCSITGGCEKVLTSYYSTIYGIPVSLIGTVYYLLIAAGCLIFLESKHISKLEVHKSEFLKFSLFLTIPGFVASLWFVFLQVFVLHSYCAYCMVSATITTILFVLTVITIKKYRVDMFESLV